MLKLGDMDIINNMCSEKDPVARFLTIYQQESSNGYHINSFKPVRSFHKTISDRIAAAKKFITELDFRGEVVCDSIANEVMNRYESYPERILILHQGIVAHISKPDPYGKAADIQGVMSWLRERRISVKGADFPEDILKRRDASADDSYDDSEEVECST